MTISVRHTKPVSECFARLSGARAEDPESAVSWPKVTEAGDASCETRVTYAPGPSRDGSKGGRDAREVKPRATALAEKTGGRLLQLERERAGEANRRRGGLRDAVSTNVRTLRRLIRRRRVGRPCHVGPRLDLRCTLPSAPACSSTVEIVALSFPLVPFPS